MIVITEYKLDKEQTNKYIAKGYRIARSNDNPYIKPKESVGFLLSTLYPSTINLIEKLLYFHHTITLKLDEKVYTLNSLEDWKYTCQSDTDPLKQVTKKHPVYQAYLDNRKEYIAKQKAKKLSDEYELHFIDIPEEELSLFLSANAKYYGISVDFNNKIDMFKAYQQIKYYQEHDIPVEYEEPEEVEYFGDVTYLEDMIYKNAKDSC